MDVELQYKCINCNYLQCICYLSNISIVLHITTQSMTCTMALLSVQQSHHINVAVFKLVAAKIILPTPFSHLYKIRYATA